MELINLGYGGCPQVEDDRHERGKFPMDTWHRVLGEVGFVDLKQDSF
jgi:hypothetical protein